MATTTVAVPAADLLMDDTFRYGFEAVSVVTVTPLALQPGIVEVYVHTESGGERWIDYVATETVEVLSGPSVTPVHDEVPAARPLATPLALAHVSGSRLRTLPTSAALVLYALAAVQDSGADWPSTAMVARAAGLADSTTAGHLRSLVQKGVVGARSLGWVVL